MRSHGTLALPRSIVTKELDDKMPMFPRVGSVALRVLNVGVVKTIVVSLGLVDLGKVEMFFLNFDINPLKMDQRHISKCSIGEILPMLSIKYNNMYCETASFDSAMWRGNLKMFVIASITSR